jgi:hypothetical protein
MTDSDLDKHFPRATRMQRLAIKAYHACGWTIEPMSPDSDEVEIHQPTACDCTVVAWIRADGKVVSL